MTDSVAKELSYTTPHPPQNSALGIKHLMALLFSYLFLGLSIAMAGMAIYEFGLAFLVDESLATGLVKSINMAIVSLAIFELGLGISKEYSNVGTEYDDNILSVVRRSTTRFVAVVCVALVLEGLIMVIKYSQLDMAGNLYYPVAIILSAAILLLCLGGFLKLTADVYCGNRLPQNQVTRITTPIADTQDLSAHNLRSH